MHRGEVQAVLPAKLSQIRNRNTVAIRVTKSVPGQRRLLSLRTGQWTDVVPDPPMSAVGSVDPFLLGTEQLRIRHVFEDLEFEIGFAEKIPGSLQWSVVMRPFAERAPMDIPAPA